MKNLSPRWTCRIIRRWHALRDGTPREDRFGHRHIAACADCQEYFAASDALDIALRQEAARLPDLTPAGLDQRILHAVTRSTRAEEQPRRRPVFAFALAATAMAAAVVVGLLQLRPPPMVGNTHDSVAVANGITTPTSTQNANAGTLTADVWKNLAAPITNALQRDPLQAEVDSVVAGARWGVRFLALNFLPTDPSAPANGSRRSPDRADG